MKVAVIMGSDSDFQVMKAAVQTLHEYGVETVTRVLSAHRTPEAASAFARAAKEEGIGVIIAAAGMAAHLAGAMAANTTLPVIGVPLESGSLRGMDALLATVQMPPGIPVATVGVNGAQNAALLAIQMLALSEEKLAGALVKKREEMAQAVARKDEKVQAEAGLL